MCGIYSQVIPSSAEGMRRPDVLNGNCELRKDAGPWHTSVYSPELHTCPNCNHNTMHVLCWSCSHNTWSTIREALMDPTCSSLYWTCLSPCRLYCLCPLEAGENGHVDQLLHLLCVTQAWVAIGAGPLDCSWRLQKPNHKVYRGDQP